MSYLRIIVYIAGLSVLLQNPAHAARVWLFQSVDIKNVEVIHVGSSAAVRIEISDASGTASYSCLPTQQSGVVSYWASSFTAFMQSILAIALSAQAQGATVDMLVEATSCNASANWPNADGGVDGLGLELRAIRIRGE